MCRQAHRGVQRSRVGRLRRDGSSQPLPPRTANPRAVRARKHRAPARRRDHRRRQPVLRDGVRRAQPIACYAVTSTTSFSPHSGKSRSAAKIRSNSYQKTSVALSTGCSSRARADTLGYRTNKFVHRNKLAVALIMLSLLGGGVTATYQAGRAERRFQQVRKLANTFLFDFDDKIQPLNGSTEARQMVARTALEYLDSRAQEAGNDAALTLARGPDAARPRRRGGRVGELPRGADAGRTPRAGVSGRQGRREPPSPTPKRARRSWRSATWRARPTTTCARRPSSRRCCKRSRRHGGTCAAGVWRGPGSATCRATRISSTSATRR